MKAKYKNLVRPVLLIMIYFHTVCVTGFFICAQCQKCCHTSCVLGTTIIQDMVPTI